MKKIQFILACIAISFKLSAQSIDTDIIQKVQPGKTTKAEVEKLLGKATELISKDDQARWRYLIGNNTVQMEWYKNDLRYYHISTNPGNRQWNKNDNVLLEIGTGLATVINRLGLPTNMRAEPMTQLTEYTYEDRILHLSFKDGQLLRYEVNGLFSRK